MSAERLKRLTQLHEERRRAQRDDVDFPTVATRRWTERFEVRLLNISPMGFHARGKVEFERDQKLKILLPIVGEVEGQIAWALTGCCGGWFPTPIPADAYQRVLAAIKLAGG
ncbi:MAG TPA: hypothetical protein VF503_01495 [Sphingobium sp.]|uniref:hypothetical protein n=1 Tax=Sphingobium sp. TaxID=1912891 RepID=UPI002ED01EC9